ncbi:MAG TPA: XylR N-terminal domain-containing protein [Pseudomonadota bacterium]|jgi:rsbT co-antagonist protein RsbR|nr:XylR N-terminal domain-containing protein [Pseudomonadota bacterium]
MKVEDMDQISMLSVEPGTGRVLLAGTETKERCLIFRRGAFATLRKALFAQLGPHVFRAVLSQFGFRCGTEDFHTFHKREEWDSHPEFLSAAKAMQAWQWIDQTDRTHMEFDRKTGHFHMTGTWTHSYEAEAHLAELGASPDPVCHMLTGYASGWATAFMGADMIAIEPTCVARGDSVCTFEIKPPADFGDAAKPWMEAIAVTEDSLFQDLAHQTAVIEEQTRAIRELATPVIEVWDEVLALPIVGRLDTVRGADLLDSTLHAIAQRQARCLILDVTGVDNVDTHTAGQILKVARAAELLGVYCVLTGIRSQVAHTLVGLGVFLGSLRTLRTLKDGLKDCLNHLKQDD